MMATRNLPDEITGKASGTALKVSTTAGNYASAPYVAGLAIAGSIDVRWFGSMDDWAQAGNYNALVSRYEDGTGNVGWLFASTPGGLLRLSWSEDGTTGTQTTASTTVAPGFADGAFGGLRVTMTASTGAVSFYTSSDDGATWDLLETIAGAGATSLYSLAPNSPLMVGQLYKVAGLWGLRGTINRVEVRDGIDGTIVANPDFTQGTIGPDGADNVWTINGSDAGYVYADGSAAPVFDIGASVDAIVGKANGTALSLPGTVGNYASAPYVAGMDVTGDIDVRFFGSLDDWSPESGITTLVGRWDNPAVDRAFLFYVGAGGNFWFYWSADGEYPFGKFSSTGNGFTDGEIGGVRATMTASTGQVNFYTSTDDGETWDALGVPPAPADPDTSINVSSLDMEIGSWATGTLNPLPGTVQRVEVRDGIDGTIVANPDFTRGTIGTDGAGNVWTINGANSGYVDAQGESVTVQGSYVDETVGRRAFTWDAVNGRWQMTYGDTGWRDVLADYIVANNPDPGSTTVDKLLIRRVGNRVLFHAYFAEVGATVANWRIYLAPTGFHNNGYTESSQKTAQLTATRRYAYQDYNGNINWDYYNRTLNLYQSGASTSIYGTCEITTDDAWPTSLPGTASGSIPSGFAEKAATGAIPVDEIEDAETGTADIETKPKPKPKPKTKPKPRKGRK